MKLSSLLLPERIALGLRARTLQAAISEIMDRAERFRPTESIETIVEAVLKREAQGSTAAEHGLALPHARIPGLRDFYVMLGVATEPLEDKGLDGLPIDLVFLILSSDEKSILMLQTMSAVGLLADQPGLLHRLHEAPSREAVWQAIDESGVRVTERLRARDIMRQAPVIARPDMTLRELLDLLFEHGVYEAPVCSPEGEILGAVGSAEVIEAGFPNYMSRIRHIGFLNEFEPFEEFFKRETTIRVADILNPKPLVVHVDDPPIQVVSSMRDQRQQFALVQDEGRFAGMIDRNDIVSRILRM